MNEVLPKLAKQKIDLENEIYGFSAVLKINEQQKTDPHELLEILRCKKEHLVSQLALLKDNLENLTNSSDFDQSKITLVKKFFAETKILEQLLEKNHKSSSDKVKLWASKKNSDRTNNVIQMDPQLNKEFALLSNQEDLINDASQKTEKVEAAGNSILEHFEYQKAKSKAILGGLKNIGKDLNISKWTSGMINRRLESDKKLIFALFIGSIVFVIFVKYLLRKFGK